jgi:hypothetical protein
MVSLLFVVGAIGCFVLAAKALWAKSIPLSGTQRIEGGKCIVVGIALILVGLLLLLCLSLVRREFGGI